MKTIEVLCNFAEKSFEIEQAEIMGWRVHKRYGLPGYKFLIVFVKGDL